MNEPKSKTPPQLHQGQDHSAPYPVSRLAPAFHAEELGALQKQVEQAELATSSRAYAQLNLIAEQIQLLQSQAREVLHQAQQESALHRAVCRFNKVPGKTYHLYRHQNGEQHFSMLSPTDWNNQPPQEYIGSYRLGSDMSWTAVDSQETKQTDSAATPDLQALLKLGEQIG